MLIVRQKNCQKDDELFKSKQLIENLKKFVEQLNEDNSKIFEENGTLLEELVRFF